MQPETQSREFRKPNWLVAGFSLLLLSFIIVLLARFLFAWPMPLIFPVSELGYGTDLVRESLSIFGFTAQTIHQAGQFSLWRPYLLSGAPLIGHPVAPVMYPPNWLALLLPLPTAFNLLITTHLWAASVGTYAVLRQMRLSYAASFLGGALFACTPRLFTHLGGGHLPLIEAIAWWPWALLALNAYWRRPRLHWGLLLGIALAAHLLNDGRYTVMSGLCLVAATSWHIITQWRAGNRAALRQSAFLWLVGGGLALGLAAIEWLPLAELLPLTTRGGSFAFEAALGGLEPLFLLNTLFRSAVVAPESYTYFGVTLIPLLLYGLSVRGVKYRLWYVSAFILTLFALGTNTPVYWVVLRIVPVLALFREPGRWYPYAVFALVVAGAGAFDQWQRAVRPRPWLRPILLAFGGLIVLQATGQLLIPTLPFFFFPQVLLLIGVLCLLWIGPGRPPGRAVQGLLIVLILVDIGWVDLELIRPQSEHTLTHPTALTLALQSHRTSDERVFAPYGLVPEAMPAFQQVKMADGYDPFILSAYAELSRRMINCDYTKYVVAAPPTRADAVAAKQCAPLNPMRKLLALLNVRDVVLPITQQLPDTLIYADETARVYDIGAGFGRAFAPAAWEINSDPSPNKAACIDRLTQIDPQQTALIETGLPESTAGTLTVRDQKPVPNGEQFTVEVSSTTLMIRSEVWAPGWQALIDGQAATVIRADCTLQGVWLPPGSHSVTFLYQPRGFTIGVLVSIISLLILCGLGGLAWFHTFRS